MVSENKQLFASFESIEETLRSYVHKCEDLTAEVEEFKGAKADLNETCVILEGQVKDLKEKVVDGEGRLTELAAEHEAQSEALEAANVNCKELSTKNSNLQVWPLTQFFSVYFFVKNH